MAIIYDAVLNPTKEHLLNDWVRRQPWFASTGADQIKHMGAYRFDDPDGEVGMETHILKDVLGNLYQVPLTYRPEPVEELQHALITEMEHSILGRRWIYDASHDPVYLRTLARVLRGEQDQADEFMEKEEPGAEIEKTFIVEVEKSPAGSKLSGDDLGFLANCIDHTPNPTPGGVPGLIGHFPNSSQRYVLVRTSNPR